MELTKSCFRILSKKTKQRNSKSMKNYRSECYENFIGMASNLISNERGSMQGCIIFLHHSLCQWYGRKYWTHANICEAESAYESVKKTKMIRNRLIQKRSQSCFVFTVLIITMCIVYMSLQILDTTHSHKMVQRVQDVFRRMTHGILGNSGIGMEVMLVFIHGLVSESLPLVTSVQK